MSRSLSELQVATHRSVFDGPGSTDASARRHIGLDEPPAELADLVRKIRDHAYRITDADVDGLRARYTEDQLFEVIVSAALGAAEYRLHAALATLDGACD